MIINEAAFALTEGTAAAEAIDQAMKKGTNYPFGPLEWAEKIGLDDVYAVLSGLYRQFGEERYRPAPLIRKLVHAGWVGGDTDKGFYHYQNRKAKEFSKMREAVIIDAVRTPIGKLNGALTGVRPDDLASHVIKELMARVEIDQSLIEDVYFGCANQAGEDNRNVARMGLLLAGIPDSVPGVTVNRLCGSGLEAVNQASSAIKAGLGDVFIAGGTESMTRAPYVMMKPQLANLEGIKLYTIQRLDGGLLIQSLRKNILRLVSEKRLKMWQKDTGYPEKSKMNLLYGANKEH